MAAEKQFENKVKAFLKEQGVYFVKFFGCAFTRAGVPDLLCCVNGRFVAVEIKAENGKPSLLQLEEISKVHEAGGVALVIRPSDFDKFKGLILGLKANDL